MGSDNQAGSNRRMTSDGSQKSTFANSIMWLLVIFLVLFPKGGIKISAVPLTWGYLLIALSLPFLIAMRLLSYPLVFRKGTLAAVSSVVPFSILFLYSCRQNGIGNAGGALSDIVSLFVLPFAFLLIYPAFYPLLDGRLLSRLIRFNVLAAAIFGIALFLLYPLTGHLFEIPFLTVNADDYGLIEATKHINRGFFLKLISTYNNGNVYGVSTLILLPIYDYLEPIRWRRYIVKAALILTLSRTVWAGLICLQILSVALVGLGAMFRFPKIVAFGTSRRAITLLAILLVTIGMVSVISAGNLSFLLDTGLGGRREGLDRVIQATTVLPSIPVGAFFEIAYLSALYSFGISGFLAFTLVFISPLLLTLLNPACFHSPIRKAALKGLIVYMMVAWLDGAINLIPVMAFYWFAYMIFLEGWPGSRQLNGSEMLPKWQRPGRPLTVLC